MIAYIPGWEDCPLDDQIEQYTHVLIAFAVSYQWAPGGVTCSSTCEISTPQICANQPQNPLELIQRWHAMGKKVILSFGGATMGGSWLAAPNGCWENCYGREEQVASNLAAIVDELDLDGVDIDYEYYYEDNQKNSGFYKGAEAQFFLSDLTRRLRTKLPDKLLLHVPMDSDLYGPSHSAGPTAYYNLLKELADDLDFVMPQYYNGFIYPPTQMSDALEHYADVINIFDDDASKVVFGHCINDCPGFNVNGDAAALVMRQLSDAYPCNGGAFFWKTSHDNGGWWSSTVNQEMASNAEKCSTSPVDPTDAPVEPTTAPVDPTDAPVEPTSPPVDPTDAPVEPTVAPVDPTDAPVEPTSPPVELTISPVEPTNAPVDPPSGGCVDLALPGNWGANGAYDCNFYNGRKSSCMYKNFLFCHEILFSHHFLFYTDGGTAYCAHSAINDNCCFCGGGSGSPVDPTDAPVEPTNAPVDPTNAPVEPTNAPVEPTNAPVEPTNAPVEPTDAPVDRNDPPETDAPETDAPTDSRTDSPTEYPTWMPTETPTDPNTCVDDPNWRYRGQNRKSCAWLTKRNWTDAKKLNWCNRRANNPKSDKTRVWAYCKELCYSLGKTKACE